MVGAFGTLHAYEPEFASPVQKQPMTAAGDTVNSQPSLSLTLRGGVGGVCGASASWVE